MAIISQVHTDTLRVFRNKTPCEVLIYRRRCGVNGFLDLYGGQRKWRKHALAKRGRQIIDAHGVTSQETVILYL